MKKFKVYLICIISTLLVGILAGLLTMGNMDIYSSINRPALTPPSFLFPIVWTILYTLMGISLARVYLKTNSVPGIYLYQLLVNFIWPILFFNLKAFLFSFIWLILLIALVVIMIARFYKIDKLSGILQIPYFIWLLFAGYLNFMVYILN